ncbi:MAG: DUF4007 family protein [Bacteroidota bacterium]
MQFTFSGHETFQCRSLWLKKGYDFIRAGNKFSQADAVVHLGVGKNMVSSIRYWMNAFGFLSGNDELAKFIFGPRGKDPYLEHPGSLWLLHYRLVTQGVASLYHLVFNEFRRERPEFTKEHLKDFLKRKCQQQNEPFNPHIVDRDIGVFLKTYVRPSAKVQNIEEEFAGLLLELDLMETLEGIDDGFGERYRISGRERNEIPWEVLLFCILSNEKYGSSVSFYELLNGQNSVGSVFALSGDGLMFKINELTRFHSDIVYKNDAGVRELQFKSRPERWELLRGYYGV